jgi:hypothetical protein
MSSAVPAGAGIVRHADAAAGGHRLAGLPIEEWLFFVVVPVCALLTAS